MKARWEGWSITTICLTALLALCSILPGCGGYNNTTSTACAPTVSVFPANVTLNHAAAANTQQFGAAVTFPTTTSTGAPTACPSPTPTIAPFTITWSTSDPVDVPISNNHDATNGTATCVNVTHEPVTVIATLPPENNNPMETGSALVTCN